ncbi:MAG: DegV family protein, partial [Corynebacterium variabile]
EAPVPLSELPAVPMHLDIHQAGCPEIAEELRATLRADLPDCVVISVVDLSPALMVHTGPEAIGITLVQG